MKWLTIQRLKIGTNVRGKDEKNKEAVGVSSKTNIYRANLFIIT